MLDERLLGICQTTDGCRIAEEDKKIRGTSFILEKEQSCNNEYINLIFQYPNMYQIIKKDAKDFADKGIVPFHGIAI